MVLMLMVWGHQLRTILTYFGGQLLVMNPSLPLLCNLFCCLNSFSPDQVPRYHSFCLLSTWLWCRWFHHTSSWVWDSVVWDICQPLKLATWPPSSLIVLSLPLLLFLFLPSLPLFSPFLSIFLFAYLHSPSPPMPKTLPLDPVNWLENFRSTFLSSLLWKNHVALALFLFP